MGKLCLLNPTARLLAIIRATIDYFSFKAIPLKYICIFQALALLLISEFKAITL